MQDLQGQKSKEILVNHQSKEELPGAPTKGHEYDAEKLANLYQIIDIFREENNALRKDNEIYFLTLQFLGIGIFLGLMILAIRVKIFKNLKRDRKSLNFEKVENHRLHIYIRSLHKEIGFLIAQNRLKEASQNLIKMGTESSNEAHRNQAILISRNFSSFEEKERIGVSGENTEIEKNRIAAKILDLSDEIKKFVNQQAYG